ncbi:hypothetical protein M3Y99_01424400 [Aphelenchoides fujianensis]|nr:hypothetical protein M3Y99_01424400 [Aphelenchoides fujianensis]
MGDSAATSTGAPPARTAHCFGLFMVHSTFVTLVVVDLLLLSHLLIFTITNFAGGQAKYEGGNPLLAALLPFYMFVPLLFVEIVWLATCLLSIVSLKTVLPYLQLPYLLSTPLLLATLIWVLIRVVEELSRSPTPEWPLVVFLGAAMLLLLEQLYFLYVKLSCFKMLIRKRKVSVRRKGKLTAVCLQLVSITEHHHAAGTATKMNMAAPAVGDCQFDTYSTQSTIIITDDFLNRQQQAA